MLVKMLRSKRLSGRQTPAGYVVIVDDKMGAKLVEEGTAKPVTMMLIKMLCSKRWPGLDLPVGTINEVDDELGQKLINEGAAKLAPPKDLAFAKPADPPGA